MRYRHVLSSIMVCFTSVSLTGCGGLASGPSPESELNMAAVRETIESGGVPNPDAITVDGFFKEHVLFTDVRPDTKGVFVSVGTAWHHDFNALTPQATIQVGLGTNIDPEAFHRGALNLGLIIDTSRTMNDPIDNLTGTTRFDAVKIAIDRMLPRLTSDDLVSMVVFNDQSETVLEAVPGTDFEAIKRSLDGIVPDGGVDPAGGLLRGLQVVARHSVETRLDRVMVFTDAQLYHSGSRRLNDFLDATQTSAENNIGTIVFGVGSDFDNDVSSEITQIPGGNAVPLGDFETIVRVFDEEFNYLVAPIAKDVTLTVNIPFEFDVVDVQGLHANEPLGHTLVLNSPTLLLSPLQSAHAAWIRLRAGSLVNLDISNIIGQVTLNYATTDGDLVGVGPFSAELPAGLEVDAQPSYFKTQSTQRGILLLNTALTLKAACNDVYRDYLNIDSTGLETAVSRITEFLDYFDELAAGLPDSLDPSSRSLTQERALLVKLRSNLGE